MTEYPNRCRLVLVVDTQTVSQADLKSAISAGDVASVILHAKDSSTPQFEEYCKDAVSFIQTKEIPALVADSTQTFGRSGADGIFAEREKQKLDDYVARFSPQNIVGCGNVKNRHGALLVGELKPDFIFFGKLAGDIRPEPHPKNIALAHWWSELVELSAIVMGGSDLTSVVECADTGVEFVGLAKAVFEHEVGPAIAVAEVNRLLDENAPAFDEGDI